MSRGNSMNVTSFKHSNDWQIFNWARHLGRHHKRKCSLLEFLNRNRETDSQRKRGPEIMDSRLSFQICSHFKEARCAVIKQETYKTVVHKYYFIEVQVQRTVEILKTWRYQIEKGRSPSLSLMRFRKIPQDSNEVTLKMLTSHYWEDPFSLIYSFHGLGWTLGAGDGQGGLACCGSWGRKESDMTEWWNWAELMHSIRFYWIKRAVSGTVGHQWSWWIPNSKRLWIRKKVHVCSATSNSATP